MLKQKAKVKWLNDMDQNTKFFHSVIKEKAAQHRIVSIQDSNGINVESDEQITDVVIDFYENLIGKENEGLLPINQEVVIRRPVLDDNQITSLTLLVTPEEIKAALFDISELKASRHDGYGSGFFSASWDIVYEDIVLVVTDFFTTGKLLKQLDATRITLIPKKNFPVQVGDYRPIACCNTL